jgi:putative oxidoreductase
MTDLRLGPRLHGNDIAERRQRQPGTDVALLALRLILATCMGAHGLIKVFGFFGGPGLDTFSTVLRGFGFSHQVTALAWVTGVTEVFGSAALVLGLLTPLSAAGLFGIDMSIVVAKAGGGFFEGKGAGFEFELTMGVIALALLLAGAGRVSLDHFTPWGRRPLPYGIGGLVLAVVACVVITALF